MSQATTRTVEVGVAVSLTVRWRATKWIKAGSYRRVGEVIEVGTGAKAGRVRVRWLHALLEDGTIRPDGKRTWYAADKLTIN